MKKRIFSLVMALTLIFAMALSTSALAVSKTYGDYTLTATKYSHSSYHLVSGPAGTYPVGSGTVTYRQAGDYITVDVTNGASYSSYWTATKNVGSAYTVTGATTSFGSHTVSA